MRSIKAIFPTLVIFLGCVVFTFAQTVDHIDTRAIGIEQGKPADAPPGLIAGNTYPFWKLDGVALEDMSSGTTELIAGGADNENSAVADLGFVFRFDNGLYTTFGANSNGFIKLGTAVSGPNNINFIDSAAESPKIAPFWDDLCIGSGGQVRYKNVMSGNLRKLIVEWTNVKTSRGAGCDGSGTGTFQVWLFDRTGAIWFVYGNGVGPTAATDGGYSIGLQSGASNNFVSVTSANNTPSYTVPNNGQPNAIVPGTSYVFQPLIPDAPINGGATVTDTTANLTWIDHGPYDTNYLVRRTTDHVNFFFVGYLGANAAAFSESGLTPSTQYYYYVNALSEGAFSDDLVIPAMTSATGTAISSTAAGGNWSSPSTWAGGVVPTEADDVTITGGATVVVDTEARAANLTIGTAGSLVGGEKNLAEGGSTATLTFQETAGHVMTVSRNVTIGTNGVFTTGGGTVDSQFLNVGGNLTNNGTLDFSTNNNLALAVINFTGNSSATFGGAGAVTDIYRIQMNKASPENIVELNVPSFTVKGSATDGPGSAYLFLTGGVFKISGTFPGSHRTFGTDNYDTLVNSGFWLNNPNYTVTARATGVINGVFRLSAGEFNAGTTADHYFGARGRVIVEGGRLNVTGRMFAVGDALLAVTGGRITACKLVGGQGSCDASLYGHYPVTVLSGGEIVIQNTGAFSLNGATLADVPNIGGTTVRFGNELTPGPVNFTIRGWAPNVVIDTSAGFAHTLTGEYPGTHVMNMNIPAGSLFRTHSVSFHGQSIVNNGQIEIIDTFQPDPFEFDDATGLSDVTYSGTGVMLGTIKQMNIRCRTMTFDPAVGNLVAYNLKVTNAHLVNANRITLGRHDSTETRIEVNDGALFDVAPNFDLGPNWQRVSYRGVSATGPEIHPNRYLSQLAFTGPGTLTIAGGDLSANNLSLSGGGIVKTGPATLSIQIPWANAGPPPALSSYVDGNLRMPLTPAHGGHSYVFQVGQGGYTPVTVGIGTITTPSALTIRAVDMTLPGLDPAVSASRYWTITEEGSVVANLTFWPHPSDINGNQANYLRWRSNGGTPVQVPPGGVDQLTGNWGLGAALAPASVSVSGTVTTSGGQPIRNALMTISGGGLPAPVTTSTGNFGTYSFENLPTGGTFTVQVSAKRYRFTPSSQMVTANNNVANVNFAANPE